MIISIRYLVALLAQGLRLDKCLPIVGRLKSDPKMVTGMSSIHTHLARAAALLGEKKTAKKSIAAAVEALKDDELRVTSGDVDGEDAEAEEHDREQQRNEDSDEENPPARSGHVAPSVTHEREATGGKRAWKKSSVIENESRAQSLALFRAHKIGELRKDIELIEALNERQMTTNASISAKSDAVATVSKGTLDEADKSKTALATPTPLQADLLPYFLRVLSLHTAANVEALTKKEENAGPEASTVLSDVVEQLAQGVLLRFGLSTYLAKTRPTLASAITTNPSTESPDLAKINQKVNSDTSKREIFDDPKAAKKAKKRARAAAAAEAAAKLQAQSPLDSLPEAYVGLVKAHMQKCLRADGTFDFAQVFDIKTGASAPLKLEICSGAGEWAVAQARADTASNYVTLELRHDRVYQTFFRALCAQTLNVCAIGGDANVVLKNHLSPATFSHVFINHPEPPQQTGGKGSEGKHLLTLDFFDQVARVLKPGGQITIVTDNVWYARFLVKALSTAPHPRALTAVDMPNSSGCKSVIEEGEFKAYVGKPSPACGHAIDASSYFDRLWKRGNLTDRYIIVLKKTGGDTSALRIRQYKKGAAPTEVDTQAPKAKKIKFED